MGKISKKQQEELRRILVQLEKAKDYLWSDRTAIAYVDQGKGGSALCFRRDMDNRRLSEVNKDHGSHLCMLPAAIKDLIHFMDSNL